MRKKSRKTEELQTETAEETAVSAVAEAEEQPVLNTAEHAEQTELPKEKLLTPKQKRIRTAVRFLLLNVGIFMMSLSVYFFQTPNNFTLGGVAGIAILLSNIIPLEFFSQSVVMAIINVLLLILGLIILGKQCTIKTIYCSLLYTFIIWLFEFTDILGHIPNLPKNDFGMHTLTEQPFLEMVYAILLFGVGGALVFNCGASSGGTDIIALILKKYTKINVGMALMIIDLIVVCVSIFTFQNVEIALFSFMGLFAKSWTASSRASARRSILQS